MRKQNSNPRESNCKIEPSSNDIRIRGISPKRLSDIRERTKNSVKTNAPLFFIFVNQLD